MGSTSIHSHTTRLTGRTALCQGVLRFSCYLLQKLPTLLTRLPVPIHPHHLLLDHPRVRGRQGFSGESGDLRTENIFVCCCGVGSDRVAGRANFEYFGKSFLGELRMLS